MKKLSNPYDRIAFVASDVPEARAALEGLTARYGNAKPADAEVIVALGGDGLMLQTLHRYMNDRIPIYGMNRGSVGFLMNEYSEDDLRQRLAAAQVTRVHPLSMVATDVHGKATKGLAINEVSLFRQIHQAAKLSISVDGTLRLEELICDGLARCHARRLDCVQSLRSRPHTAARRQTAGADADQPLPPPPLARRAAAR